MRIRDNLSTELGDKRFAYDYVLGQKSSQEQVYDSCIADLLSGYLSGYNATVMAYGQTGSGKTFTMGTGDGNSAWGESKQDRGILPRVIYNLFDKLATKDCDWELRTSFVEIYNEQIKDLLSNSSSGEKEKEGSGSGAGSKHHRNNKGPAIREAADGSIKMTGVVEEEVESAEAMLGCLHRGSLNRSTGKTAMNSHSSRSHAIFSVYLRMTGRKKNKSDETETSKSNDNNNSADAPMNTSTGSGAEKLNDSTTSTAEDEDEDEDDDVITAKFHFVDLAGSERLKRTGAVGARMREGISINCGLLALANVISALTEGSGNSGDTSGGSNNGSGSGSGSGKDKSAQRQRVHVPFRDSKITRLLQDSLGGNSNTLMIACVSPANTNGDETTSTLRYAARARNIKNQARVNRDPNQEKMLKMRMRIRELETQLTLAGLPVPKRSSSSSTLASSSSSSASSAEAVKHVVVSVSNEELQLLRDQCTLYEKEMMRLTSQCSELRRTLSERSDSLLIMTREKDVLQVKLQKRTSAHSSGDGEASNHASMDVDAADVDVAAEVDAMSEVRRENLQLRDQIAALKKQLYLKRLSSLSSSFTSEDSGGDLETSGEMECGNDDDSNMVRNDTADADADMDSEGENEAHSLDLEQEAVNEEVKGIESLSALKTREHDLRMRQLKQAKSAIKGDLHQQQALVDELTVTQRKHAMMQKQYLSKVKSMTAEVQTIEKQRDELLLKIEQEKAKAKGSSGSGSNNGSDKASSLRIQRFADKVKTLESELSKFRGKLKTHERLKQQFKDNQKKIERLNAGIDKGKQNQIKLTRQMRDKAEIYRLWMKEKDNRVKSLMKESRKQKIQMQRLQDAMSKQTAVLKRASEERSHLQSKLRRKEDVTARADKMRAARKLHKSKRDRVRAMNGGDSLDAIKKKKRRINNFTNNGAGSSTSRGNYVVTKETTSKPLKTKREGAGGLKSVGSTSAAGSGSLTARNVKKGKSNYMSSTLASQTGKVQRRKSDKDREMEGREKRKKAKLNTSGGSLSNTAAATDKPKQLKKRRRSFTGMIQPLSRHLDGRGAGADKPAKMNTSGGVNGDENSNTDATSSKNDSFAAPSSQLSMKEKLALYKQQKVQHVTSTSSTSSPSSTNDGADSFPTQSTHHSYNHQHPSDTSAHTDSSPSSNTAANSKKKDKAQSVVSTLKTELLETLNNGDLKVHRSEDI